MLVLPEPRGPVSAALLDALRGRPGPLPRRPPDVVRDGADPLEDEDLQLSLYLCYELHYRGLPGVDDGWEWEPALLRLRRTLERRFEAGLLALAGDPDADPGVAPDEMDVALRALAVAEDGPPLSRHVEGRATRAQVREFLVHRSAYQLKEADPHSWAMPRLTGRAKAALVEIQFDEYGEGHRDRMHAELFARAMEAVGLDARYGAYVDHLPAVTLATVNLMSLCGLHRRLLGAIVGHLALFEMTSSVPNRRYAKGLRRLGWDTPAATTFFDEHVEADAVHEAIAAVDLAGGLAQERPHLAGQVLWGARALARLEARWAGHLLDAWAGGRSSLRHPLEEAFADAPAAEAVA